MLVHTGDKSHGCGSCGKTFAQKGNLKKNKMLIHSDDKSNIEQVENHPYRAAH